MRQFARDHFWESFAIPAEPQDGTSLLRAKLEARDAIQDVVGPISLAVFAVVDDIDADGGLLPDNICHCRVQVAFVFGPGRHVSPGPRGQFNEFRGADKTADVRRQDSIYASLHSRASGSHAGSNVPNYFRKASICLSGARGRGCFPGRCTRSFHPSAAEGVW